MRKFRHKKTGVIAGINELDQNYHFERISGEYSSIESIHKSFVEDSNDWEEVKEEPISWYIEKKTPIYSTTDGVEIFEGQRAYIHPVSKDFKTIYPLNTIDSFSMRDKEVADRLYCFMTIESRDKYIKENSKKPIFVSADNAEIFETKEKIKLFGVWISESNGFIYKRFETAEIEYECNKNSQINTTDWMWFVDEKNRKEYIDKNKTKYSFLDILNAYNNTCSWATFMHELKKLGK